MNQNLLRMKKNVKICVFDFETENLNLFTSKPWQFACVQLFNNQVVNSHDIYIKWPNLRISKEAEIITRFDRNKWNEEGRDPKEVFLEINEIFDKADYIAGHNILGYDIHIYRSGCKRLGIKPLPIHKKMIDTLACGKGIKLEIPYNPTDDFLKYQIKMLTNIITKKGFATLSAFAKYYDIQFDETRLHDALYDVELNAEVLKKMLWNIEI